MSVRSWGGLYILSACFSKPDLIPIKRKVVAYFEKKEEARFIISKCFEGIFGTVCLETPTHGKMCHQFWCLYWFVWNCNASLLVKLLYGSVQFSVIRHHSLIAITTISRGRQWEFESLWHRCAERTAVDLRGEEAPHDKLKACWEDKEEAECLSSPVSSLDCWSSESAKSVSKSSPIPQSLTQAANT